MDVGNSLSKNKSNIVQDITQVDPSLSVLSHRVQLLGVESINYNSRWLYTVIADNIVHTMWRG